MRKLPYASSLGCPYACHYCTDQVFYERKFNAYSASRVIAEVTDLVARQRLSEVAFLDSNFPVNVGRAVDIARGFIDSNIRFSWTFQASTDLLCRMSDDDVCLLGESGVTHMGFGTESASEKVLTLMNKKHQHIEDMFETARKSEKAGIRVTFNLILGYPGETEADRQETFRVMTDISRQYSNVRFSPNIFTPYPGIPIWPQLRTMGVEEPQSLAEWADVGLGCNRLPWLQGQDLLRLKRMLESFQLVTLAVPADGATAAAKALPRCVENVFDVKVDAERRRCGRCSADSLLPPLLRSQAGSKDAAVSAAGHALCGCTSSATWVFRGTVRQHAGRSDAGILRKPSHEPRPRIVAIYEDNFNFLSKMCLSRMRQIAFDMIDTARDEWCKGCRERIRRVGP